MIILVITSSLNKVVYICVLWQCQNKEDQQLYSVLVLTYQETNPHQICRSSSPIDRVAPIPRTPGAIPIPEIDGTRPIQCAADACKISFGSINIWVIVAIVMRDMKITYFIDFLSDICIYIYMWYMYIYNKVLQPVETMLSHSDCCTTTLDTIMENGWLC